MNRYASTLLTLFLLLAIVGQAQAQDPVDATIREINAISQDNIDMLNAAGAALTQQQFQELTRPARAGEFVRFTAVVLTNPRTSGLGTPDDTGFPDRIHVYVRDTSAVSQGYEGMGLQLVDGSYTTTGLLNVAPGDVITVTGSPDTFVGSTGASMQVAPQSIELLGPYTDFGLPDEILDPVLVAESSDVNMNIGGDQVQVNWNNLSSLNGQYVRIEGATIAIRDISSERPNWLITTDGGTTVINFYDMSLFYRNDRDGSYNEMEFNVQDDDFVPPPPGASVNIQGTLVFQGDDPFSRGEPDGALLSIVPWEPGDLVVTETPPEASVPSKPDAVPAEGEAVTVTTTITIDPSRTLGSAELTYFTSADQTETTVAMTDNGDGTASAEIPGQDDGVFVIYSATVSDNTGSSFTSNRQEYRVLNDGINEVSDIQAVSGFSGDASPFAGLTLDMDLTGTVQSNAAVNQNEIAFQDDDTFAPWTGIILDSPSELEADLQPGDVINITSARIAENFGVTELQAIVYTTVTEGGDILGYKDVTTDMLQDPDVAEAHEGMLVNFDDAVVTSTNPDAPAGPFGEWAVSSDGTADNQVRVDDRSNGISFDGGDAGTVFAVWERLDFIRGIWWYSFGNYKLMPDDLATDVGAVINVATEGQDVPGSFALRQNYPNPFNPSTAIEYTVPATGRVSLEVFDMLGRSVAVLVNAEKAVGTYTVQFNAGDLASGLYLYRLTAGSNVQVKKMMLLK